jgi:hypothetical protein
MTYTAVNPHACCNWPRPEDADASARQPPHPLGSFFLFLQEQVKDIIIIT